jgi:hypothetical protein
MGMPHVSSTLESLFGNRKVIAAFDLPGNLQALTERIPSERKLSAERMIDELTLYPYFSAFEPPKIQKVIRQAMIRGDVEGAYLRLGLAAFRIERLKKLRFCPDCADEMQARYGELYWRRDHQLSSALVCAKHGALLLESSVNFTSHSRHEFIAATKDNCPIDARPFICIDASKPEMLKHLQRLSARSAELLTKSPIYRTFAGWTALYRSQMLESGLAKSAITMNQQVFEQEFRNFYGDTLDTLPMVIGEGELVNGWLATMVRKHRKANHPLYHLLLQDFFAQREKYQPVFGKGPWPCINPLASHQGSNQIKTIQQHRNHGKTVGVFSCQCGYVYTRWFDYETSQLGPPRFHRYGPMLEPVLRDLVCSGRPLRNAARVLQLDPKTVVRLAGELGISVPWKLKLKKKQQSNGKLAQINAKCEKPTKVQDHSNAVSIWGGQVQPNRVRLEWAKIDRAWLCRLKVLAKQIRDQTPPIRISLAELERRAEKRSWTLKRAHRLPQSMAYLNQIIETTVDFQLRRIYWVIEQLEHQNLPVVAWRIMRMAGLKPASNSLVMTALENVTSPILNVA